MVEINTTILPEYIKKTLEAAGIDILPPQNNSQSTINSALNTQRNLANTRNLTRRKTGRH